MSLNTKLAARNNIIQLLKQFPDDSAKVYPSFIQIQTDYYNNTSPTSLPSEEVLKARAQALSILLKNTNKTKFSTEERLYHPSEKPDYYANIVREAHKQNRKDSFFTAVWHSVFGWFK